MMSDARDALGRMTGITASDAGTRPQACSPFDELQFVVDGLGMTAWITYGALSRMTSTNTFQWAGLIWDQLGNLQERHNYWNPRRWGNSKALQRGRMYAVRDALLSAKHPD